ncbi:hypothetical protein, partial [Escherichia coli]|uniref:hypothetical protein n=1 Tax=Escherichia coli TaxID=562 RepID=UPI001E2C81D1
CIDAMKYNVEGFGYDIVYVGDDPDMQTSPEAKKEYQQLFDFFDGINEDEGYTKIAVKKREDLETIGCACYEIIRSRNKKVFAMYHAPMMNIRLAAFDKEIDQPVKVTVNIKREGKVIPYSFGKYFKRFCQ